MQLIADSGDEWTANPVYVGQAIRFNLAAQSGPSWTLFRDTQEKSY
jgi:hypothetical protein